MLTNQYKTSPEERFIHMTTKKIGMNIIIFACMGSPMGGCIFCWTHMLRPIRIVRTGIPAGGVMKGIEKPKSNRRSGAERS